MTTETVIEKKKQTVRQVKEPNKFKVIVCNDDVTPVEFVVAMLVTIFKFDTLEAYEITLKVHNNGSAVAGVYPFEVAEQKAIDGINMARNNDFPLILKVEEEK
jgi:ATP-dependent Clp protease adaptor protein ClpS